MSFMPNPGSRVRLKDGRHAVVTRVTPDGKNDEVAIVNGYDPLVRVTVWDIEEVLFEPASCVVVWRGESNPAKRPT